MAVVEVIEEIKEPEKIPEIYSTFRRGMINVREYFYFKMYTKGQRSIKKIA